MINIKTTFPAVAKALRDLPKEIADKATVRSLNRTVDLGKVEMAREIAGEYRLKVSEVKARLAVKRAVARGGRLSFTASLLATNKAKGRSINLIAFQTGALTARTAKKAGRAGAAGQLGFQIKRAGGRKVIPGAFIGNDGRTVFIRTGKERLPIKALGTIDVPQMFNSRKLNAAVTRVMLSTFEANFNRELRVVLGGFAK